MHLVLGIYSYTSWEVHHQNFLKSMLKHKKAYEKLQIRFRMIVTCVKRKKTTFVMYLPTNQFFVKSEHHIIPLLEGIYFTQKKLRQIIFLKIQG